MVFKPERNRDNKGLDKIQPILLGASRMALSTDGFPSAKSEVCNEKNVLKRSHRLQLQQIDRCILKGLPITG